MSSVWSTPMCKKPVFYGSDAYSLSFVVLIGMHGVLSLTAISGAVMALYVKKGGRSHIFWGSLFVYSMIFLSISGILSDVIRLMYYKVENHSLYHGYAKPSTVNYRYTFIIAALTTLNVLYQVTFGKNITNTQKIWANYLVLFMLLIYPAINILVAFIFLTILYMYYNILTRATLEILIFTLLNVWNFIHWYKYHPTKHEKRDGVLLHAFNLLILSVWSILNGILQMIPAFVGVNKINIKETTITTTIQHSREFTKGFAIDTVLYSSAVSMVMLIYWCRFRKRHKM